MAGNFGATLKVEHLKVLALLGKAIIVGRDFTGMISKEVSASAG